MEPPVIFKMVSDEITIEVQEHVVRRVKEAKWLELVVGDDLSRKTGRHLQKCRLVNRKIDWYLEIVRDPKSENFVHFDSEPLSKHRGHGSDRRICPAANADTVTLQYFQLRHLSPSTFCLLVSLEK